MLSSDISLFGETSGLLQVQPSHKVDCGVISGGWPSFAFGAIARGWNLKFICLKNNEWSHFFHTWFPHSVILNLDDNFNPSRIQQGVSVWYSDIDPPRIMQLWLSEAKFILTQRRVRHVPGDSWRMLPITLTHVQCGGVTDGSWKLCVYHQHSISPFPLQPTRVSGRNLHSLLDSMSPGRPCMAPTAIASTQLPVVIRQRANTYHCDGLLPWGERRAYITSPSVFSPTKWVRRRLTPKELLSVLDIPDSLISVLSEKLQQALLSDYTFLPMKVALSFINMMPYDLLSSPIADDPKRRKLTSPPLAPSHLSAPLDATLDSKPPATTTPLLAPVIFPGENDEVDRNKKATKSDDAPVPEYLWDRAIVSDTDPMRPVKIAALTPLRAFALCWWKRNLTRGFLRWFQATHRTNLTSFGAKRDKEAGVDCITRAANSTWWEWKDGSRPFFWRWPSHYQAQIRDGLRLWHHGSLPRWRVPQRHEPDPMLRERMRLKLLKVRLLRYIIPGFVSALTSYFAVPKGDSDIRMVYDGTKSGLNACLWAPWFPLPTIEMHLRSVVPGTFMGDIDIGDMFLNFMLHSSIRTAAGVDLTPFFPEELDGCSDQFLWELWGRCAMGFKPSPYQAVQGVLHADEYIRGDPSDPSNVFRWDLIHLNLPGSTTFDPSFPWVCKRRASDGQLAADFIIYVDDVRTMGGSFQEGRAASRRAASLLNFLGIQDAPRKRRDPSLTPGAWSGSIVLADGQSIDIIVAQERWDKAKNMVSWMSDAVVSGPTIEHKTLERYRGYLIYICRTYPAINPYLKGIHLTLDSWRPWRKDDGWRMTLAEMRAVLAEKESSDSQFTEGSTKAPSLVTWVPRFPSDIQALSELFSSPTPPRRQIRPSKTASAVYQFGDASGQGYGSSLMIGDTIFYRHGQWNDVHSRESSNFRELANLIYAIEDAYSRHLLDDVELFFFTDNTTAEAVFYKGTSTSEKLFDLILRLRKIQMTGCLILHVIHVAGKRMIAQGTDGLSRGVTCAGVMEGQDFRFYVPLHQSAVERQGASLKLWVTSWYGEQGHWIDPKGWYTIGHTASHCIWTPPPAATDAALEQLGQSIHKRPQHSHIVLVPRLMTYRWRKLLGKICDLVFTVPLGTEAWSNSNFEPLIVGIYFPFCRHEPWRLKGTPLLERAERALRDLPPTSPRWGRIILRELFAQAGQLDSLPPGMVRPLLCRPRQK